MNENFRETKVFEGFTTLLNELPINEQLIILDDLKNNSIRQVCLDIIQKAVFENDDYTILKYALLLYYGVNISEEKRIIKNIDLKNIEYYLNDFIDDELFYCVKDYFLDE